MPRHLLPATAAAVAALAVAAALLTTRGAAPAAPPATAGEAALALQQARETGDPAWYARAERAARAVLARRPADPEALDALGELALARHRFADALALARQSRAAGPERLAPLSIAGDALIELGRHREGFAVVQRRLELRPDLTSYSRASYVQELTGNRAGAVRLMALAADAGRPGGEPRAWARVQLGLLRLGGGDHPGAERELRRALAERPGDPRAEAGLARVLAARGRLAAADRLLARALARQPLPEHAALRAEVAAARGRPAEAREHLALVHAMGRLMRANGVRTDLDLALIEADVRRPDAAAVARARLAWRERPGVVGDGVLGWVLTRAGRCREGLVLARRSLRLGTDDPLMRFHAGMAAACAGERDEARRQLSRALALNPRFSLRWAPVARASLREVSR